MNIYRFSALVVTALVLSACGGTGSSSNPSVAPKKVQPGSLDIKDNWALVSKKCGGREIPPKEAQTYKLDKAHFVRVESSPDSDPLLCRTGFVYDRVIQSAETADERYQETGILKSTAAKKTCWKKDSATLGSPESEDVFAFGPEQMTYSLNDDGEQMSVELKGSPECTGARLSLQLKKKPRV